MGGVQTPVSVDCAGFFLFFVRTSKPAAAAIKNEKKKKKDSTNIWESTVNVGFARLVHPAHWLQINQVTQSDGEIAA